MDIWTPERWGFRAVPSGSQDAQSLSTAVYCQAFLVGTKERRAEHADVKGSGSDKFFISDTKPFQSVQSAALAMCLVSTMQEAGIELPRLTVLALQLLLIWCIRVLV